MASKLAADPRIDPRIKAMFGGHARDADAGRRRRAARSCWPRQAAEAAKAAAAAQKAMFDAIDNEEVAPSAGLVDPHRALRLAARRQRRSRSSSSARTATRRCPASTTSTAAACRRMSCFDGMYRAWGRIIAAQGVAVAMVDFRNCLRASSAPEVAPFPAGLNDCVSGLKWVRANAAALDIDPARIVVAGESGGGNLTLATGLKLKRDGDLGLIKGLYALCPYIAGQWPRPELSVLDREQRHPARPAQQPRRHGLRHRGVRARATRWPGRRSPPTTTSRACRRR